MAEGLLEGRTILVTGVGPGLGREIVHAAYRDGASVVIGARREESLRAVAEEVDPSGERVAFSRADITDPEQVRALVALAEQRFGGLHGLVNNAALDAVLGGLEATTDAQWREVFEVNVFATIDVVRAAVPLLKIGGGSIVFTGSQQWIRPAARLLQLAYGASKGALVSAAYQLAEELGPARIRVNTVAPGWMWGPMMQTYVQWQARAKGVGEDEVKAGLTRTSPLRTMAEDSDVAEAVVFLLSDRARAITGQTMLVNAGEHMR